LARLRNPVGNAQRDLTPCMRWCRLTNTLGACRALCSLPQILRRLLRRLALASGAAPGDAPGAMGSGAQ
jgi:hypothetical protein